MTRGTRILRFAEWTDPVPPVRREVVSVTPEGGADGRPPLLFVPGPAHAAWAFAEHWLPRAAERGYAAHALSLRGTGESGAAPGTGLRAYTHDVVQAAAALPRRAVLIGHGAGALVVRNALARYPARAAVLAAPVPAGPATLGAALRANPFGTLPAFVGGRLRLNRRQLFGPDLPPDEAQAYLDRLGRVPARVHRQLVLHRGAEPPVGDPPVLVLGSPDDRVVPRSALDRTAARYGGAPLLFPGMGHDLMLDARWEEPIDALLDWLDKETAP